MEEDSRDAAKDAKKMRNRVEEDSRDDAKDTKGKKDNGSRQIYVVNTQARRREGGVVIDDPLAALFE